MFHFWDLTASAETTDQTIKLVGEAAELVLMCMHVS